LKPSQIRIFTFRSGATRGFLGFAEHSFRFFVPTLLLQSFSRSRLASVVFPARAMVTLLRYKEPVVTFQHLDAGFQ
jgi:hypothetical protein